MNHTMDVLERVARDHVGYELKMMGGLAEPRTPEGQTLLSNALLEAYLLHVRNLHEFLTRTSHMRPEHVLARDYFDGPWPGVACLRPGEVKRINQKLAHITVARTIPTDWSIAGGRGRWAQVVLRSFGRFVRDLNAVHPHRAEWFAPDLKEAKSLRRASVDGRIAFRELAGG